MAHPSYIPGNPVQVKVRRASPGLSILYYAPPRPMVLASWIEGMAEARVLTDAKDALIAQLGPWLVALEAAAAGDGAAKSELFRWVALYGRALGAEGKPASAAVLQAVLLEDAYASKGAVPAALKAVIREVVRVISDAHALGASQRQRGRHQRELREQSPVFRFGQHAVVGFLVGAMEAEQVDALFGRVLRECARTGLRTAIVDVFGASADDDLFHHTVRGFTSSTELTAYRLIVTGLRDPDRTRAALVQLGADLGRIELLCELQPLLDRLGGA